MGKCSLVLANTRLNTPGEFLTGFTSDPVRDRKRLSVNILKYIILINFHNDAYVESNASVSTHTSNG